MANNSHSQPPTNRFDHLRDLLLLTHIGRLERKFGAPRTAPLLDELSRVAPLHSVTDPLEGDTSSLAAALRAAPNAKGVIILGGYDILAPERVDVRDEDHFGVETLEEFDREFLAWTDDWYGDWQWVAPGTRRAVRIPRLPVSRVPDRGDLDFMASVLATRPSSSDRPLGLRNKHRIFAEDIFQLVSSNRMLQSTPVRFRGSTACELKGERLYIVLHGEDDETMRWYGEDDAHERVCAITKKNIDAVNGAIVFTAACWGACLSKPAHLLKIGERPKHAERLALAFLVAGASAVVGVTGIHHSPDQPIPHRKYLAGPMHEFFWTAILEGLAPAAALHKAKREYANRLHFTKDDEYFEDQLREQKTVYEFTCLGSGW